MQFVKKKVLVQFDGSNFYKKVKRILPQVHLTNFDYAELAQGQDQICKSFLIEGNIQTEL
ncbi:hypothetical protein HYU94_00330 [Candidatus Daviesbacteria bacterium]|nr:hypothetical protein [Candidatus Daviesbacteria bacterium]